MQKVLKKIIISYYKHIGFDEGRIKQMDSLLESSIDRVGREMCGVIAARRGDADSKKALQGLADVIMDLAQKYDLSKDEKRYWKEKDDTSGKQKIGFCIKKGYLSFKMDAMLKLINSGGYTEEEISKHLLSKQLKEYGLAFVDSEKNSVRRCIPKGGCTMWM